MIYRGGGRYWELILLANKQPHGNWYMDGTEATCDAALYWLDGDNVEQVRAKAAAAMVSRPGENGSGRRRGSIGRPLNSTTPCAPFRWDRSPRHRPPAFAAFGSAGFLSQGTRPICRTA